MDSRAKAQAGVAFLGLGIAFIALLIGLIPSHEPSAYGTYSSHAARRGLRRATATRR